MSSLLNLTQRQMCEKIAEAMQRTNLLNSSYVNMFTTLLYDAESDAQMVYQVRELCPAMINDNFSLNELTVVKDEGIVNNFQQGKILSLKFKNVSYVNENPFPQTIIDVIRTHTLVDYFGDPIMDVVNGSGQINIINYLKTVWDYGTTGVSGELWYNFGGTEGRVFTFQIYSDGTIRINDCESNALEFLAEIIGCTAAGTYMIFELCRALADGIHDPSSFLAILRNYANSRYSEVSSFAAKIIRAGRSSLNEALNAIIQLFRQSFIDYHENADGTITWNIQSRGVISLFWQTAGSIALGLGTALGQVLLYTGKVVGKIVGALITIGVSALQSVATQIGTITGSTPYVNDDAIDHCYHDPVAQCDDYDYSHIIWRDNTLELLERNGRAKIVTPCCVIYLYNYNSEKHTVSWKVFPSMDSIIPALRILKVSHGWADWANPMSGHFATGCVNMYNATDGVATDKYYGFNCNNNNGKIFSVEEGQVVYNDNDTKHWNFWQQEILTDSDAIMPVKIKTNSPDSGKWTSLWDTLRMNVIATLSLVYCTPYFYSEGMHTIDNAHKYADVDLGPLFYYRAYTGAPGYDDIVKTIVDLANVDHSSDLFLACLLYALGLCGLDNVARPTSVVSKVFTDIRWDSTLSELHVSSSEYVYTPTLDSPHFLDDHVGLFEFLSIDPYSYVTPPSYDYKSIIYGALFGGLAVGIAVGAFFVAKSIIKRRISFQWQKHGQNLLDQGEVFRNPFTPEEWKQLSPADRAEYRVAWKKYNKKVKLYNKISGILGLESLDWVNNWWNPYDASPGFLATGTSDLVTPAGVEAMSEVIDSVGRFNASLSDPTTYSHNDNALILYRLIAGRNPN